MKRTLHPLRRLGAALLALTVSASLMLPAAASEALGEDLSAKDTVLHQGTALSRNVFWSTSYSDLRTENLITYSPSSAVTPIVTFGESLTQCRSVSAAAKALEEQGCRVVAGLNGDFFNTNNGLPIGLVITEGELRSSDGGYFGVGFRADGSAILGKPGIRVTADLGYQLNGTEVLRTVTGVNKARVSTGGIYLYTYDFNARHTTGTTDPGVDVVCSVLEGSLSVGGSVQLLVEQVLDGVSATPVPQGKIVLSAHGESSSYYADALRGESAGNVITVSVTASQEGWEDVQYAVGALYSLVENGQAVTGLPTGASPRTAVGQKADGSLLFYTIDGRQTGYSIGASLSQVAARLIELGCVSAVCLDGGGSTALTVTAPDSTSAQLTNTPSEGYERAVTNQIFLVAESQGSGILDHFYVTAESDRVLAGSSVAVTARGVDSRYIPMEANYTLAASAGILTGGILTTPAAGGDITVTASGQGRSGSTVIHAVKTADSVQVLSGGKAVTALTLNPGKSAALTAVAVANHLKLKADNDAFTWTVTGDAARWENGRVVAVAPGSATLTVTGGGKTVTVPITVTTLALKTVEGFETAGSGFYAGSGSGMTLSRSTAADLVRMGRGAGKAEYTLSEEQGNSAEWRLWTDIPVDGVYNQLNLWVCGDQSGNTLSLLYANGSKDCLTAKLCTLDFSGWKQISFPIPYEGGIDLQGFTISAGAAAVADDGLGGMTVTYPDTARTGTVYLDQITASFVGIADNEPPVITLGAVTEDGRLTAAIQDASDGILPRSSVSVTWDGAVTDFTYSAETGTLTASVISDGAPHRLTVYARDGSGNIGRASYDCPVTEGSHHFTDTEGYWAADYVDYLYTAGITTGYADGTFRPGDNITRAQFAAMLFRYLKLDGSQYEGAALSFADAAKIPDYARTAVKALCTIGVVNGVNRGGTLYFDPNATLTRAQAAAMIGRTQEKGFGTAELRFTDAASVPAYASFYIQTMVYQGILSGYSDGSFHPGASITRGQMAKILYHLL